MGKGAGSGGQQAKGKGARKITLTELSEHRTKETAWMSYHGKVHLPSHPLTPIGTYMYW